MEYRSLDQHHAQGGQVIICICARGNVRSATAALVLRDFYGLRDVFAIGKDTMSDGFLYRVGPSESTQILIVGDAPLVEWFDATYPELTRTHIDIGADVWLMPGHPDLVARLLVAFQAMGQAVSGPFPADPMRYLSAHTAAWNRHHMVVA